MDREWSDTQPIYRQLRDRVVALILDGLLNEGDPLPSVRNVAAEYRINPITVLKGYQQLVDEQLVETKRGRGMFVKPGARNLLLESERTKFLAEEWPENRRRMGAGYMHTGYYFGIFLAAIANYFVGAAYGWRAMFAFGGTPALLVSFIRYGVHESDRWRSQMKNPARRPSMRRRVACMWWRSCARTITCFLP